MLVSILESPYRAARVETNTRLPAFWRVLVRRRKEAEHRLAKQSAPCTASQPQTCPREAAAFWGSTPLEHGDVELRGTEHSVLSGTRTGPSGQKSHAGQCLTESQEPLTTATASQSLLQGFHVNSKQVVGEPLPARRYSTLAEASRFREDLSDNF